MKGGDAITADPPTRGEARSDAHSNEELAFVAFRRAKKLKKLREINRAGRCGACVSSSRTSAWFAYVAFAAVMELALAMSACAMRMLAMSMSLPSKDTAPRPSFAACAMASMIRLALVTSASDGV